MEFVKDLSVIEQKLDQLKKQGFTRLCIPGGTSKDGSHYSGVVLHVYDPNTLTVYFVAVPYDPDFHKQGDENGHTKKMGEKALETGIREVIEETGLTVLPEDFQQLDCSYCIPDNRDTSKKHYKNFYLADKFSGNLFAFEGANPIDAETAAPVLIPASLFVKIVFKKHQPAILEAIRKLRAKDTEYGYALMNL